jgi:hypothetical protein
MKSWWGDWPKSPGILDARLDGNLNGRAGFLRTPSRASTHSSPDGIFQTAELQFTLSYVRVMTIPKSTLPTLSSHTPFLLAFSGPFVV